MHTRCELSESETRSPASGAADVADVAEVEAAAESVAGRGCAAANNACARSISSGRSSYECVFDGLTKQQVAKKMREKSKG